MVQPVTGKKNAFVPTWVILALGCKCSSSYDCFFWCHRICLSNTLIQRQSGFCFVFLVHCIYLRSDSLQREGELCEVLFVSTSHSCLLEWFLDCFSFFFFFLMNKICFFVCLLVFTNDLEYE